MKLDWNPLKENVFICGLTQSGKTNLGLYLIFTFLLTHFNVIIVDPHNKFTKLNPKCVIHNTLDLKGVGLEIIQSDSWNRVFFKLILKKVMTFRNVVIVIDELHNFCSKYRTEEELDYLVRNCNNRHIGYVALFQRPQEVPTMIMSNARHRFCFPLDYPSDIKFMSEYLGKEYEEFVKNDYENFKGIYKKLGEKSVQFFKVPNMD